MQTKQALIDDEGVKGIRGLSPVNPQLTGAFDTSIIVFICDMASAGPADSV
jgi:hypothetical protein